MPVTLGSVFDHICLLDLMQREILRQNNLSESNHCHSGSGGLRVLYPKSGGGTLIFNTDSSPILSLYHRI